MTAPDGVDVAGIGWRERQSSDVVRRSQLAVHPNAQVGHHGGESDGGREQVRCDVVQLLFYTEPDDLHGCVLSAFIAVQLGSGCRPSMQR